MEYPVRKCSYCLPLLPAGTPGNQLHSEILVDIGHSEEWTIQPLLYNGQIFHPLPIYHFVHTLLPPMKGQPLNNGQNAHPYSDVPCIMVRSLQTTSHAYFYMRIYITKQKIPNIFKTFVRSTHIVSGVHQKWSVLQ